MGREEKSGSNMFLKLIIAAALMVVSYFVGINVGCPDNVTVVEQEQDGFDLEMPNEVEKRTVTVDEVETRIAEIGELSTYSMEYSRTLGKDEVRYFFSDVAILGTRNNIEISCDGVVKVGYELSDIAVRVTDDKIYIAVPEAHVTDNYIIWDSIECTENNNILNPIEFDQYKEIITEIEKQELKEVTSKGLYQDAEDNLKKLIGVFLADFSDYTIEDM